MGGRRENKRKRPKIITTSSLENEKGRETWKHKNLDMWAPKSILAHVEVAHTNE